MTIEYDHAKNPHALPGPLEALRVAAGIAKPSSILDIGCGTGTWMRAALTLGITDIVGIDGVQPAHTEVPRTLIKTLDITSPFSSSVDVLI